MAAFNFADGAKDTKRQPITDAERLAHTAMRTPEFKELVAAKSAEVRNYKNNLENPDRPPATILAELDAEITRIEEAQSALKQRLLTDGVPSDKVGETMDRLLRAAMKYRSAEVS